MKFFYIVTLFTLLLTYSQVNAKGYYCLRHIVLKSGDQCSDIYSYNELKDYYIRSKELMIFNPTLDCNNLEVGTKVCIEVDLEKTLKRRPYNTHVIRKNDINCDILAKKLNTTRKILENVNFNILNCNNLMNQARLKVEISYQHDGDYVPTFTDSTEIKIINEAEEITTDN